MLDQSIYSQAQTASALDAPARRAFLGARWRSTLDPRKRQRKRKRNDPPQHTQPTIITEVPLNLSQQKKTCFLYYHFFCFRRLRQWLQDAFWESQAMPQTQHPNWCPKRCPRECPEECFWDGAPVGLGRSGRRFCPTGAEHTDWGTMTGAPPRAPLWAPTRAPTRAPCLSRVLGPILAATRE